MSESKQFQRALFTFVNSIIVVMLLAASVATQSFPKADVWEPLKFFVGAWEGTIKGKPGQGTCAREYQFVLNNKFLHVKNRSTYAPQEKNPKGEVHEDWGMVSYDRARKTFVLRQFHVEGFVNQYVVETLAADGKTLSFMSESFENILAHSGRVRPIEFLVQTNSQKRLNWPSRANPLRSILKQASNGNVAPE